MSTRPVIKIILVLTVFVWGWVGYRVLATQTGRLGSVAVRVTNLATANKFVQWSPRVESYKFNAKHELLLPAMSTALFLLNPPKRFSQGTVAVIASGEVNLAAEYPPGAVKPIDSAAMRTWRWREITRFPGGHRLHIENLTNNQIIVSGLTINFQP